MTNQFKKHIPITLPNQTALEHLSEHTRLSKQKIKQAMQNGAVWHESPHGISRIRRAKKTLATGDALHFYYDDTIQNIEPETAMLVADEGQYSIWNKPYGMYSQGTKWGDHCTVYRYAEKHLKPQRSAFPVHRLDRAASGLIILAHSKTMATAFSTLFKAHQIQKQYKATVEGDLKQITLPYLISTPIDGKPATSRIIAVNSTGDNKTLITIEIETGRKHQIRKHLSTLGFPIIGDRLYGSAKHEENLQLQSCYLKFNCPLTNTVREYSLK